MSSVAMKRPSELLRAPQSSSTHVTKPRRSHQMSSVAIKRPSELLRAPQSSSAHVTKPRRAVQFLLSTTVTRSRHTTSIHRMHHAYPAPGT